MAKTAVLPKNSEGKSPSNAALSPSKLYFMSIFIFTSVFHDRDPKNYFLNMKIVVSVPTHYYLHMIP